MMCIALKASRFSGRNYAKGEIIHESAIDSKVVGALIEMGFIKSVNINENGVAEVGGVNMASDKDNDDESALTKAESETTLNETKTKTKTKKPKAGEGSGDILVQS